LLVAFVIIIVVIQFRRLAWLYTLLRTVTGFVTFCQYCVPNSSSRIGSVLRSNIEIVKNVARFEVLTAVLLVI
jgi:hypothetical protein